MRFDFLIVCGLESSGNHLTRDIIKATGCYREDEKVAQRWWNGDPVDCEEPWLTMHSLPHGGNGERHMPAVWKLMTNALACGKNPGVVIPVRDQTIALISRVGKHQPEPVWAAEEQNQARVVINNLLQYFSDRVLFHHYEAAMYLGEAYIRHFLKALDLPSCVPLPVLKDANVGYLRQDFGWVRDQTTGERKSDSFGPRTRATIAEGRR